MSHLILPILNTTSRQINKPIPTTGAMLGGGEVGGVRCWEMGKGLRVGLLRRGISQSPLPCIRQSLQGACVCCSAWFGVGGRASEPGLAHQNRIQHARYHPVGSEMCIRDSRRTWPATDPQTGPGRKSRMGTDGAPRRCRPASQLRSQPPRTRSRTRRC